MSQSGTVMVGDRLYGVHATDRFPSGATGVVTIGSLFGVPSEHVQPLMSALRRVYKGERVDGPATIVDAPVAVVAPEGPTPPVAEDPPRRVPRRARVVVEPPPEE